MHGAAGIGGQGGFDVDVDVGVVEGVGEQCQ